MFALFHLSTIAIAPPYMRDTIDNSSWRFDSMAISNLYSSFSWGTLSKALAMSRYITSVWIPCISKICHHAKAIAFSKSSLSRQKLKFQKTCQNPFCKSFTVVLCKKPIEKTLNIRKMREFWKSAILQRPLQNPHLGSKTKIPKNMSKSILQII